MTLDLLKRFTSHFGSLIWITTLFLVVGVSLALLSNRANAGYSGRDDLVVNDKGWVAWASKDIETGLNDIFLDTGIEVIQLTDTTDVSEASLDMSNDALAWIQGDGPHNEIVRYQAGKAVQITDNDLKDFAPQVSDEGTLIWMRQPNIEAVDDDPPTELMLHKDGQTIAIEDNCLPITEEPVLNRHGWVAWKVGTVSSEIFLYDGTKTIQVTNDKKRKWYPQLSDSGHVVWSQWEEDSSSNLYLFDGSDTIKLMEENASEPVIEYVVGGPTVAWLAREGGGNPGVYVYNGAETIQLTDSSTYAWDPLVNDRGWVTWIGFDGNDRGIFLWDGTAVIKLTDDLVDVYRAKLNNIGWDTGVLSGRSLASRASPGGYSKTSASGWGDDAPPQVKIWPHFVSTKTSKTPRFKVRWSAFDPAPLFWEQSGKGMRMGESGVDSHSIWFRPHYSSTWTKLAINTKSLAASFRGRPGITYSFKVRSKDNAGNISSPVVRKTVIPYNEGAKIYRRVGFKLSRSNVSRYYQGTVRYSYQRGHTLVYKLENTNGIGLISTKAPNRGRAKIYVDGKYVKTVDTKSSKFKPRQMVFYKGFAKKGTHFLRIENLGTPGRARFDVDGIVAKR